MLRSITLIPALSLVTGLLAQSSISIGFPLASARLSSADEAALRALCERADIARVSAVEIVGHTDLRGSAAYNQELSRKRAERVRDALATTCLKVHALSVRWSGEQRPLTAGGDEASHASNRRVEVTLRYEAPHPTAALPRVPPQRHAALAHQQVQPLMPFADKQQELHACDPAKGIDFVAQDGVRVRIPAGAIVNSAGMPASGTVQIGYRSFSEPYEIIASGIPMHVSTAAGVEHFETAGMYEVYAQQDGERLALAPGARIELTRPNPAPIDPGFGTYRLDEQSGQWVGGGSITAVPVNAAPLRAMGTDATAIYWDRLGELQTEQEPDSTSLSERRRSPAYCHTTRCDDAVTVRTGLFKRRTRTVYHQHVPTISVRGHRGVYDPSDPVFVVSMAGDDDIQFPEWRRLPQNAIWRYAGNQPRELHKRLFLGRHAFRDITLDMEPGATTGILSLKEDGQWLDIPVSIELNLRNGRDAERWLQSLLAYEKALEKRENRFDRRVRNEAHRYAVRHANEKATAWNRAKPRMIETEAAMDLEAWHTYALARRPRLLMEYDTTQINAFASIQTTFGLESFGVYNIDRIMKMPEQQEVLATTTDAAGKPFPWVRAYAVLRGEASVITYWGGGKGSNDNMLVAPGRMKTLFLVDANGAIARADVAPLNTGEPRAAIMCALMDQPTSIEELQAKAER